MKSILTATALLVATVVADKRDLCADGSTDDLGNNYCQKVTAITYTGVGGSGSYNKISNMDKSDGTCSSSPSAYSGALAPFDEEVSMHFRGPLWLKQFAVYTPGSSSKKSKTKRSEHIRRHAHGHAHAHGPHNARNAALGDEVIATMNGQVVSWANDWSGEATTASSAPAAATPASDATTSASDDIIAAVASPLAALASAVTDSTSSNSDSTSSGSDSSSSGSGSSWSRQGYYNAAAGQSEGLVFLNHEGGAGSGTFDYKFGNSLSYASADGLACSDHPVTLGDTTIPSSGEVVIMSDEKCSDSNPCPYSRPGTVAYHGFDGPSKVFLYEFQMPDDGQTSASQYDSVNMPAIWMLNAQIPRTLQYGEASCSCWTSGCGEFDIFEVLAAGDTRCKSTLHGNIAGGDSDYFERPVANSTFAAVLFYNNNFHIKMYDSLDLAETVAWSVLDDLIGSTSIQNDLVSLFSLAGASGDSSA